MSSIPFEANRDAKFAELMRTSYRKVYNLAFRLSGDRSDAEDLTQDAFLRAYRSFGSFEGDRPFENWIFRIVTRLFLDLNRARRRRIQPMSYDAPVRTDASEEEMHVQAADERPDPEEALMSRALSPDLAAALRSLKPDQRTILVLADVQQLSYQEVADALNIPVGTVRSRLHRAHKKVRAHMEQAARERNNTHGGFLRPCRGCA